MGRISRKTIVSLSAFTIMLLLMQTTYAASLVLIITTKESYNLGETVIINGNLTLDGSPVPDGLVSIQINDPKSNLLITRVISTGSAPPGPWLVEILELFPCDINGNPKSSFPVGGGAGFKVTVKNNCASQQYVIVTLTLYYSNGIPFATLSMMDKWIDPYLTESKTRWVDNFIPGDAPLGTAYVYATALKNWTQYNGVAWCPEKPSTFNITSGGGGLSAAANINQAYSPLTATPGTFNTTFKIPAYGGILGNYTIYATSWYNFTWFASDRKTFRVILVTDVTGPTPGVGDGKVDMRDIVYLILRFGSADPIADINKDGIVDMKDIVKVILDFGKWGTL